MSWVDIVIIALLVLFAGFGVLKGVQKSALSLGAFLLAFVIAFFLAKPVAEAFLGIGGVRSFVMGTEGWSLYTWLRGSVDAIEPSVYVQEHFYQPVIDIISQFPGYTESFTIEQGKALYLAFTLFAAIVGVGLYIVARLLLSIATMIIKSFIGKRKSAINRLCGFFVGAVRGLLWSLALTLVFSMIGGFTFVPFINTVQTEYESAVVANYVNDWAYTLKNKMFLPNADMFARVVEKSGMAVPPEEETPEEFELVGQELDLYVDFISLNYNQDVCSVEDGKPVFVENYEQFALKPADYAATGFDGAIKAIMDYNAAAAETIKSGGIATLDTATLKTYLTVVQDGTNSIYDGMNEVLQMLYNYNVKIAEDKELVSQEEIEKANIDLKTRYDAIVEKFEGLKTSYSALASFGTLELGTYPNVVKIQMPE